ncbi:hypothetical protein [Brevibacillus brevis]|uniref:DUF2642 domain-containing protein n=1 Tax=Brevibacillus brevis TaxID=1393 RepID=A0ABY9TF44_BREBE|nr:hypothetical protein [Brevibacillus brevis]WNC17937.1 hypothetical protein RGB73_30240 [Brevibacillus brevis]
MMIQYDGMLRQIVKPGIEMMCSVSRDQTLTFNGVVREVHDDFFIIVEGGQSWGHIIDFREIFWSDLELTPEWSKIRDERKSPR